MEDKKDTAEGKVIAIKPGMAYQKQLFPEPSKACIEALKEALEQAEEGLISAVAISVLYQDGVGGYTIAGSVTAYSLVGGIEAAKARVLRAIADGEVE